MAKTTTAEIEKLLLKEHHGEQLTLAEHEQLHDHFGGDRESQERERNRVVRIANWQPKAATKAKRTAAIKAYDAAATATNKRRPEIVAAIRELNAELSSLELAEKKAERVVQEHMTAVKALRELVPAHVQAMASQRRGYINEQIRKRLNECNKHIEYVNTVSGWNLSDHHQKVVDHAEMRCRDALNNPSDKTKGINANRWAGFVHDLKAELPDLEKERDKLQKQYDAAKAECDEILNFYVS